MLERPPKALRIINLHLANIVFVNSKIIEAYSSRNPSVKVVTDKHINICVAVIVSICLGFWSVVRCSQGIVFKMEGCNGSPDINFIGCDML